MIIFSPHDNWGGEVTNLPRTEKPLPISVCSSCVKLGKCLINSRRHYLVFQELWALVCVEEPHLRLEYSTSGSLPFPPPRLLNVYCCDVLWVSVVGFDVTPLVRPTLNLGVTPVQKLKCTSSRSIDVVEKSTPRRYIEQVVLVAAACWLGRPSLFHARACCR